MGDFVQLNSWYISVYRRFSCILLQLIGKQVPSQNGVVTGQLLGSCKLDLGYA